MVSIMYEYQKKYIQDYQRKNKIKLTEYQKTKITCHICDCDIKRNGISGHRKTKKHIRNSSKLINS